MAKATQDNQAAKLTTPLGKDVLLLTGFEVNEGLSTLFEVTAEAVSETPNIDFDRLIGLGCEVSLQTADNKTRRFHGIMTSSAFNGADNRFTSYSITLRPWMWFLIHRADSRFFLEKTVIEIIKEVFVSSGIASDFEFRTTHNYKPIAYCVQYRETDFNFVSRLMEEYGIYYFFEHPGDRHLLVLADGLGSHSQNRDAPSIAFRNGSPPIPEQFLNDWSVVRTFNTGKMSLNDYDFNAPTKDLNAQRSSAEKYRHSDLETYDHPGRYNDRGQGEDFARIRLEAEQAQDQHRFAGGLAPSLSPGALTAVQKHPIAAENTDYLLLRASHVFGRQSYQSESGRDSGGGLYKGDYELLPTSRPYRALPLTPRPRVQGVHTAKIVGKKGDENEEISTDKFGRVFVQFFWDRKKRTSCPIRVAQSWAGKRWGEIFTHASGWKSSSTIWTGIQTSRSSSAVSTMRIICRLTNSRRTKRKLV